MKKIIIGSLVIAVFASCGSGGDTKDKKETEKTTTTTDLSSNPDYEKGLALIAKNPCMTCHGIDNAITGPSYRDVAKRYADRPDTIVPHLARKIINGGSGEWGEVMMTPNSNVSQEDAEAMVKYILLLKN